MPGGNKQHSSTFLGGRGRSGPCRAHQLAHAADGTLPLAAAAQHRAARARAAERIATTRGNGHTCSTRAARGTAYSCRGGLTMTASHNQASNADHGH